MRAWVDPNYGSDPAPCTLGGEPDDQVESPDTPYRTLQAAINGVFYHLNKVYDPVSNADVEGIVYAQPGVYGPVWPSDPAQVYYRASGDELPIIMRDRVHVKGVNARACIVRGGIAPPTNPQVVIWPTAPSSAANVSLRKQDTEVLVTFRYCHPKLLGTYGLGDCAGMNSHASEWELEADGEEHFSHFTLQGGDVQVLVDTLFNEPSVIGQRVVVDNCIFDMRHGWQTNTVNVDGPYVGLMMVAKRHIVDSVHGTNGYTVPQVVAANNTFVMADAVWDGSGPITWSVSRSEGVAILDVNDPGNNLMPPEFFDPCRDFRGMCHSFLLNNLIRAWPGNAPANTRMVMLGIDATDTKVALTLPPSQPTNAFAANRVGTTNGTFFSVPVTSTTLQPVVGGAQVDPGPCPPTPAPLPVPRVRIWDGSPSPAQQEYDPGFVGDYFELTNSQHPATRDWRLLPSSPLKDQGLAQTGVMYCENGTSCDVSPCLELKLFSTDSEGYANPRVVGSQPDIGCDEIHLLTMAGSLSNDSISHHNPSIMTPGILLPAPSERTFILPDPGPNVDCLLHGTLLQPGGNPPFTAWTKPPATLAVPLINPGPPGDYNKEYINLQDRGSTPTPWALHDLTTGPAGSIVLNKTNWLSPLAAPGQLPFFLYLAQHIDDEANSFGYFNLQAEMDFDGLLYVAGEPIANGVVWWSNLQTEYR